MQVSRIKLIGITLGFLALLIHWFCPPEYIEVIHGKGFFPFFSWILDHTLGLLPFSLLYVMVLLLVYLIIRFARKIFIICRGRSSDWKELVLGVLSAAGYVIAAFYFFWGFNYDRVQLVERLTWEIQPIAKEEFISEARLQVKRLQAFTMSERQGMEESLAYNHYRLLEVAIRQEAVKLAESLGYLGRTQVRCRHLAPSGILLRLSTAGFYNPLSGECNIDMGLHPLQKPFSMAHEFFHGMGITGEGDCNFLAYLLCHSSEHDFIRYSGELGYWRYLQHTLRRTDAGIYQELTAELPEMVVRDLLAIDEQMDLYPDIAPRLRDAIYSAYLKSNKIHDGLANYNRILQLTINWRRNGEIL